MVAEKPISTGQPSSTTTVQQIAEVLREANEHGGLALVDALERFAADRVTVRHHPPRRYVDGTFSRAEWIAFERSVVERVGAEAAGMRSDNKEVSVVDDIIVIEEVLVGNAPDGTPFRLPSRMMLPVRDSQILGYVAYYDEAAVPSFMADVEMNVREGC